MMKNIIVLIGVYFCAIPSFSQTKSLEQIYADSLLLVAKTASSDSMKINGYLELSNFWSDRDTATAFRYLREAKELMPPKDPYYSGLLHFYTAGIYFDREIERGKKEYMEAEKFLSKDPSPVAYRFRARSWNNYGALLQRQDREEEYIKLLLNQSIPFAK